MRGPFWNDKTGVTGEPNFRTQQPNYETIQTENGPRTLVGAAAEEYRSSH